MNGSKKPRREQGSNEKTEKYKREKMKNSNNDYNNG
jgi:hypothetical protein